MEASTMVSPDAVPEIHAEDLEFLEEVDAGLEQDAAPGGELAAVDRYLGVIRRLNARVARVEVAVDARMAELIEWRDRERRQRDGQVAFLTDRIRGHLPLDAQRFKAEYGSKSLSLAGGSKVGYSQKGGGIEVTDEHAALVWSGSHWPAAVREKATVTLSKTELAKYVEATGEDEGPGWKLTPKVDEFFVRAGGAP